MRYSVSDKTEIIRLVEQSPLSARRTLWKLGIPRSSFYRWYDRYQRGGPEGLADRPSRPDRVWNRIPEAIRNQIVDLALDQPELSPRELAVRFTDETEYFVSEASVYRDAATPFYRRAPQTREGVGLKAGALLVREWKGRLERVMILEEGFAWNGQTFGSLSQIAKAMTGTNWNGHRFFGLRQGKTPAAEGGADRRKSRIGTAAHRANGASRGATP
jgi:transposase-like protein